MANNKLSATIQIDGIDYDVEAKRADIAKQVEKKLTITGNNSIALEYDGSASKTLNIVGSGNASVIADSNGTITISANSPEAVAEIIEGTYKSTTSFQTTAGVTITTGASEKLYVDITTNKIYRWSGTAFVEVSQNTDTDTTYELSAAKNQSNGNVTLQLKGSDNSANSIKIQGSGAASVTTDNTGAIIINSTGGGDGNGDMLKSVYVTNNANNPYKVDKAINADQLGGTPASDYAKKADLDYNTLINKPTIPTNTDTTYDLSAAKNQTNGNVTLQLIAGGSGTGTDYVKIQGSGTTSVTTDSAGVITINSTGSTGGGSVTPVNNATLTIKRNGSNVATFTANSSTDATANITVPTKTSELANDSGFKKITVSQEAPTGGAAGDIWFKI